MVEEIKAVIATYQRRLMEMPYVAATSYGPNALGDYDDTKKLFLMYFFSDQDVGLLRSKVTCNT
jgi:hypothetical protein